MAPPPEPPPGASEYQAADTAANAFEDPSAQRGRGIAPTVEPLPGSPEYRVAESQARDEEVRQVEADREVSAWMNRLDPDGRLKTQRPPPDEWRKLDDEQRRAIDEILARRASGTDVVTDPTVRDEIVRGLTSPNPEERIKWAR